MVMMRSMWALHKVDAGFDAKNVITLRLTVDPTKYASAATEISATEDILAHVRALPGVTAAAAVDDLPLSGGSTQPIAIAGRATQALNRIEEALAYYQRVFVVDIEFRDVVKRINELERVAR